MQRRTLLVVSDTALKDLIHLNYLLRFSPKFPEKDGSYVLDIADTEGYPAVVFKAAYNFLQLLRSNKIDPNKMRECFRAFHRTN